MVTPVTGPFTSNGSFSQKGPLSYRWNKTRWKQTKPYNLALAYTSFLGRNIATNYASTSPDNASGSSGNWRAGGTKVYLVNDAVLTDAKRRAMDKLRTQLGERAEWLVNLIQRQQAADLVASSAYRILNLVKLVRRRDWVGVGRSLNILTDHGRFIPQAKTFGKVWLELHFGWEPMVKDIYNGINILQSPYDDKKVFGTSSLRKDESDRTDLSNYYTLAEHTLRGRVKCGCSVKVDNPNLFLANQLGLVNPATVVWELVPFSFVVDWFVPVGDFLNSFTEFLGLERLYNYTSTFVEESIDYQLVPKVGGIPYAHAFNKGWSANRSTSLPEASLRLPSVKGPSVTRAATAVSLLLQGLK